MNSSVVRAEKVPSQRLEDFLKEHHFNDQVKEFIEKPIVNYINYHEGDLSLLTELAIANDERLLLSMI